VKKIIRVNLALPPDLAEWVIKKAREENRSINNLVTTILLNERKKDGEACSSK